MKRRIEWIDALRAIMIFFIVFGHSATGGMLKKYVLSFHVPAFFFLSGYVFGFEKKERFAGFFKKKFLTLMMPYYIFSLLSILVFVVMGQFASAKLDIAISTTDILPNLFGMLYANGLTGLMKWNLPLWFIPCLFVTLLLMYFVEKIFSSIHDEKKRQLVFLAVAIAITAICFMNYYVFHVQNLPFALENAVYLLPFFCAGFGLSRIKDKVSWKPKTGHYLVMGIISVGMGFVLGAYVHSYVDYVTIAYGNLFVFYLAAFVSVFGYVCICRGVSMRFLHYLGQNTLPVLLMHKFPVVFLQLILERFMNTPFLSSVIAFGIAAAACGASLLAGAVIQRLVPFAVGKRTAVKG